MSGARKVRPSAWAFGPRFRPHFPRMKVAWGCVSFKSLPGGILYQF